MKGEGGAKKRIARTIGIATAAASSLFAAKLARGFAALGLAALVDHAAVAALALLESEDRLEEVRLRKSGQRVGVTQISL